jgi:hypothetical protein
MAGRFCNTARNNSYASNDNKNNPHLFSDNVVIKDIYWHGDIVIHVNQSKRSFNSKNLFRKKKKVQAGGGEGSGGNLGTVVAGALGGAAQTGAQALYGNYS